MSDLYVLAPDGVVEKYPFNKVDMRLANPQTSFPQGDLSDELAAAFGVYPVRETPAPAHDPLTHVASAKPVMVDGEWVLRWTIEAIAADALELSRAGRESALKSAVVVLAQKRLDDFARERGYDGILSACTYAASAVPKFKAEGLAAVAARDATWSALYEAMDAVQSAAKALPSGPDDLIAALPSISWNQA